MRLLDRIANLDQPLKWAIIVVLAVAMNGVGLKIYTSYQLREAKQLKDQVQVLHAQEQKAREEAEAFRQKSDKIQDQLDKANTKLKKLQAAVDNIVVPEPPTQYPATVQDTLDGLKSMGLTLVMKPSLTVKPSVAGITAGDANTAWLWGQQAMRVPILELKIDKQNDLIVGLDKAKGFAESLVDNKTKEADAWKLAADTSAKESEALTSALGNTEKALKAERKRKYLYAFGAAALTYATVRR